MRLEKQLNTIELKERTLILPHVYFANLKEKYIIHKMTAAVDAVMTSHLSYKTVTLMFPLIGRVGRNS